MIFGRHTNLKYKYGTRSFWCRGYYVDAVGQNKRVIEEYIKNQLKEDYAEDQISLKEYTDLFRVARISEQKQTVVRVWFLEKVMRCQISVPTSSRRTSRRPLLDLLKPPVYWWLRFVERILLICQPLFFNYLYLFCCFFVHFWIAPWQMVLYSLKLLFTCWL